MQIHKIEKTKLVRLTIKQDNKKETINLKDTTHEEAFKYLINLFKSYMFKSNKDRTVIDARFSIGGNNGKQQRISLYGISPKEIKEKIEKDLTIKK